MAEQPDYEAYRNAMKGLTILMIVLVACANFMLQWRLFRQGRFMLSTRKWLIQTISWGDNILAFWVLIQSARIVWEPETVIKGTISCKSQVLAGIYSSYFLPFVYAISIITLLVELRGRTQLRKSVSSPYLAALAVAALPWIFGLVVILPLTLVGFNDNNCSYDPDTPMTISRQRAFHIVAVITPGAVALFFAFVTSKNKICPVSEYYDDPSTAAPASCGIVMTPSAPPVQQAYGQQPQQMMYPPPPPQPQQYDQKSYPDTQPPPYPGTQPQYPGTQPQYPGVQTVSYPGVQQPQPYGFVSQPQQFSTSQQPASNPAVDVKTEQQALLVQAFINLFLTYPTSMLALTVFLKEDATPMDPIPQLTLVTLFQFLIYIRSVVTPLVWAYFDKTPPAAGRR